MKNAIELRAVIENLREELFTLTETASGEDLRFAVESIEVELQVGVTKKGEANAKATFWVLELGGKGEYGTETTQKIKLTLKPERKGKPAGERTLISRD